MDEMDDGLSSANHSVELPVNLEQNNHKLSYHNWRNELKKQKRKAQRRKVAQLRDFSLSETNAQESTENQNVSGEEENEEEEKQRQLQNVLWLEREKAAQTLFLAKKDREEKERQQKEDEQRKIKEEWEEQLRKQKELEEKQKIEKERMKEKMDRLQKKPTDDCHNPPAPPNYNADNQEQKNCPFFQKVGACRFGLKFIRSYKHLKLFYLAVLESGATLSSFLEEVLYKYLKNVDVQFVNETSFEAYPAVSFICKRAHNVPETSTTLLFPGMFAHFEMEQSFRDEFDSDLTLEYEEGDIYEEFKYFYEDVFPEFQAVGRVIQFVVCCNYEPHLRGNVYAQYASKDEALSAYEKFNGRWYNKRQLSCQFTTVDNWKSAICGLFRYKKCPKGKNCNFLHVFQNPANKRSENTSDFRRTRRSDSDHEREHSQRRKNANSRTYENRSSSRTKSYTSSRRRSPSRSLSRSPSRSPSYSRHRRRHGSRARVHQEEVDTDDRTSHRVSRSSSRKRDRTPSSVSTYRRENSASSSDSDRSERESSRRKHRKRSSRERRRGHSRKENTDADSARRDRSSKADCELGNSRIKSSDVCLKETDLTSDDKSSSSEILEDDGFGKHRNENGGSDRKSKRSKGRRHSKKSKTKTTKKLKLG